MDACERRDDSHGLAFAVIPRGWLIVGLLALTPALAAGGATRFSLAVSLGGVLLAYRALDRLRMGIQNLTWAAVAWQGLRPLFQAARPERPAAPTIGLLPPAREDGDQHDDIVLEANDLLYRYRDGGDPILRHCHLRIRRGDRILLQGPSGAGKSTLAALLLGLREPQDGVLLLHGLDRQSLGTGKWRSRISAAPQYHDNHVFAGSLAFNLLMGRRWPPRPEDLEEAAEICRELGLGPLLEHMPSGLRQIVGDSGWQMSQGEKSRLFIARALLQGAELIVFDESFGALDPESMRVALRCVFRRAPALLVIAHP